MDNLNTLFIGQVFQEFEKLASTNQYAQELLSKNNPSSGTVISTLNQHDGRGQIGSKWESEPHKNISLSVILRPTFLPIKHQFQLNQAVSLGVCDFVSKYISNGVKIKWSNDIYINDNKVCGILIQNTLSNSKIQSSIVGIGININQVNFVSNPPNPTSFKLETGIEHDLSLLKKSLLESLEPRYLQLKNGRIDQLQKDYLNHLYKRGINAPFQREDGSIFEGKITGISEIGKLLIESQKGLESFFIKEVKFL